MKRFGGLLLTAIITTIFVVIICDIKIIKSTQRFLYDDSSSIPYKKVGLVLGTSKYLKEGGKNPYFENRIQAAADLYRAKKIKYLIISGDNGEKYYNEPMQMKKELVKKGVPDSIIFLDYAGFRTFDSVVRANEVFGQSDFTVISQKFHNQRAVYIAQTKNIQAIGYNAKDIGKFNGLKTKLREKLARVKVFVDLITGAEPKYLGDKIEIR